MRVIQAIADNPEFRCIRPDLHHLCHRATGRIERELGTPVVEGYGMTEVHCYSTMNPLHGDRRAGSVDRASGLSDTLVDRGIALNGIVLVSTVLNFQTLRFGQAFDSQRILRLLQDGRHGFTGSAPLCKKINQYRFAGIDDFTKTCHNFLFILQHTIYQIGLLVWKFNA